MTVCYSCSLDTRWGKRFQQGLACQLKCKGLLDDLRCIGLTVRLEKKCKSHSQEMALHTPLGRPSWCNHVPIGALVGLVSSSTAPPFFLPSFVSAPVLLPISVVRSLSGKFLLLLPTGEQNQLDAAVPSTDQPASQSNG